jgi:hypothetical protein
MPRKLERTIYLAEIMLEGSSGRRQVRITDLSLGGCFVDGIVAFGKGERVSIELTNTEGKAMRVSGEVVWISDGVGFGVQFVDLDPSQILFLEQMLK